MTLLPLCALLVSGCGLAGEAPQKVTRATQCVYAPAGDPARPVDPPPDKDVPTRGETAVTLRMSEGEVTITMDRAKAPCAVHSFESLAQQGYFDNTRCHRLVDHGIFILQCGDPTETGRGGPGYVFADELSGAETYGPGTVAMANAGPGTNGSQFFLVWADSPLPPKYTVFGKLDTDSLRVVQDIASQGVDADNPERPISEARINGVVLG
ncbi:MAG: peptidylprolyl isomerase [Propionibacteriaceae bacterium]|nr:peptidylprolyl isomerase [Propionibacteriaceae bacterium]